MCAAVRGVPVYITHFDGMSALIQVHESMTSLSNTSNKVHLTLLVALAYIQAE
jgi:hypothetical protein